MRRWPGILLYVVLTVLPALAQADDMVRARDALLHLGQGLQAREAGRVRELLAPGVVVSVTVVESDGAPSFSFNRDEFLQTYTALWRFSAKEKVDLTLRSLKSDGEGSWLATADIHERMQLLGAEYRRESALSGRVRKYGDRFLIEALSLRTVIR